MRKARSEDNTSGVPPKADLVVTFGRCGNNKDDGLGARLCQHVLNGVQSEDPEGFFLIGRVRRLAGTVFAAVFDAPLERITGEDEHPAVMLAVVIEFFVPGHHGKCPAAKSRIELVDAWGHLYPTPLEGRPELVVKLDDLVARVHVPRRFSLAEDKWVKASALPRFCEHVASSFGRPLDRRMDGQCFKEEHF